MTLKCLYQPASPLRGTARPIKATAGLPQAARQRCTYLSAIARKWLGGIMVKASDWQSRGRGSQRTIAEYNLVLTKGWRCSLSGQVTAGLTQSNDVLQTIVICQLTCVARCMA